jgi:hypothetical protein
MPRPRIPDDEDWREQRPGESRAEYLSRYQKAYHNNVWYPAHRKERKQQVNERRRALFDWYRSYKATQKCARCPEWRPECLQFHHVDSKLKRCVEAFLLRGSRRRLGSALSCARIVMQSRNKTGERSGSSKPPHKGAVLAPWSAVQCDLTETSFLLSVVGNHQLVCL